MNIMMIRLMLGFGLLVIAYLAIRWLLIPCLTSSRFKHWLLAKTSSVRCVSFLHAANAFFHSDSYQNGPFQYADKALRYHGLVLARWQAFDASLCCECHNADAWRVMTYSKVVGDLSFLDFVKCAMCISAIQSIAYRDGISLENDQMEPGKYDIRVNADSPECCHDSCPQLEVESDQAHCTIKSTLFPKPMVLTASTRGWVRSSVCRQYSPPIGTAGKETDMRSET